MWNDPIVEAIHAERSAHAEQFDFDLGRIVESLKLEQAKPSKVGAELVTLAPRRPKPWVDAGQ